MMINPPIFITGFPRSGTTLLASLLDHHPQLAVTPETGLLMPFNAARLRQYTCGEVNDARRAVHAMLADWPLDVSALAEKAVDGPRSPRRLMALILNEWATQAGKVRAGEKTPGHLDHAETLLRWFPGSRMVVLLRDGRDALPSLMELPHVRGRISPEVLALRWNRAARRALKLAARHTDRVQWLRFEDLVVEPQKVITALASFLELKESEAVVARERENRVSLPHESWKQKVAEPIDPRRAFAWQRDGVPSHLTAAERIMAPWLNVLGYRGVPPHAASRRRLDVAAALLDRLQSGIRWHLGRRLLGSSRSVKSG